MYVLVCMCVSTIKIISFSKIQFINKYIALLLILSDLGVGFSFYMTKSSHKRKVCLQNYSYNFCTIKYKLFPKRKFYMLCYFSQWICVLDFIYDIILHKRTVYLKYYCHYFYIISCKLYLNMDITHFFPDKEFIKIL